MEYSNDQPIPSGGEAIQCTENKPRNPGHPIIPFIEGTGTGPDIWKAARMVFDATVQQAYAGKRRIAWYEVFAGKKAFRQFNDWLPQGTLEAIRRFHVSIKGSLTTAVGGGIRSLNVTLRRLLDLYVCMRPESGRRSVTLVHKGNIMKFSEGAFRDWGYELAKEEFPDACVAEAESVEPARGKILVKDRIADSMFQQVLLQPDEYDVIATTNLNGDYLSNACAAQVGGLGMGSSANIGDQHGLFEATLGTAPKYAGQDVVNPSGVILCGSMMFHYLHGLEESLPSHRCGHHRENSKQACHLRLASPDGRGHQAEDW